MELRTDKLRSIYPKAPFGILEIHNFNPENLATFVELRQNLITQLQTKFETYQRSEFIKTEPICHYIRYFKKFKKTYIVLLQIESILIWNQDFPDTVLAVQAMFLTELKHGLLIAAFDRDKMKGPLTLDVAGGGESYMGVQEKLITLKKKDIYIQDTEGIIISNIYGQDMRTRVTDASKNIMFVIMGVEGIHKDTIERSLKDLLYYLQVLDKELKPTTFEIIG